MWPMWSWCIVTLASARLKASVRFPPLRGMYQTGGTCKGCEMQTLRATYRSLRDKVIKLEGSVTELQATNAKWAASYTHEHELISQLEASVKTSDAFINNRTRYLCRIMWKLVHVSRDYRNLLLTHHQLQDDLRSP